LLRPRKRFERPSLKSRRVKLRWAGFGGTWQQKPLLPVICLLFGRSAGISAIDAKAC
jgi:hypothetical protein